MALETEFEIQAGRIGSPQWWLSRLEGQLTRRKPRLQVYQDYHDGKHPLAFASEKFRNAFGGLFREFADNWCPIVVSAPGERLHPIGFRIGEGREGDKDANRIWQANQLDAESQLADHEALKSSEAFALVWKHPNRDDVPLITIEHPKEMIVAFVPGTGRRVRVAALKKFTSDDGSENATVYLPDGIYKFRFDGSWKRREEDGEDWPLPNILKVVPVVPLINNPRLLPDELGFYGGSELDPVIPLQDGANKLVADMLVASEFASYRQRHATGIELPRDSTGQMTMPFDSAIDRLWTAKSKDVTFGEFEATDLRNFVIGIEMLIQHIASQTRTPPHYFYLKGEFPSGESIKSAETGLVAKTRNKMIYFGESWEEVIRLGFHVIGNDKAKTDDSETIWADPESRSEAEHIDALSKQKAFGVPDEVLWEKAGYTPAEIQRIKDIKAEEALTSSLFEPEPQP